VRGVELARSVVAAGNRQRAAARRLQRLPCARRQDRGLPVNRWGELWTERGDGGEIAFSHDGTLVRQSDKVDEMVPSSDPFPLRAIDPYAIDRTLAKIAQVDPGRSFVKAELTRDDFLDGGMRWKIMVHSDDYYATYAAAPDASSICLIVVSDHGTASAAHQCPDFGHQPPGIPRARVIAAARGRPGSARAHPDVRSRTHRRAARAAGRSGRRRGRAGRR
jgi:hypothetical protein